MEEPNCVADVGRPTRGGPRIAGVHSLRNCVFRSRLRSEQRLTRQLKCWDESRRALMNLMPFLRCCLKKHELRSPLRRSVVPEDEQLAEVGGRTVVGTLEDLHGLDPSTSPLGVRRPRLKHEKRPARASVDRRQRLSSLS